MHVFCLTYLWLDTTALRLHIFEQGTKVDLASNYATCEASNYRVSHIQSGFAGKNKSNIKNGDFFYFSGKHMYETTQGEAYSKETAGKGGQRKLTYEEEDALVRERLRKYMLAKAVVGKTRIQQITDKIKDGLESRVSGGTGFRRRMFALFDKSGKCLFGPWILHHPSFVSPHPFFFSRRPCSCRYGHRGPRRFPDGLPRPGSEDHGNRIVGCVRDVGR